MSIRTQGERGALLSITGGFKSSADLYSKHLSQAPRLALSLGRLTLEAHGLVTAFGKGVVLHHTYTSAGLDRFKREVPIQIAPWPDTDFYQAYYAQILAGQHDTVLSLISQPGMQDYHRRLGLIDQTTKIIELNPAGVKLGFPYTDPLALAFRDGIDLGGKQFVSTLPTHFTAKMAKMMNGIPVQRCDSIVANDKGVFQQAAAKYGFPVFESMEISGIRQLAEVERKWGSSPHGVVVRLSRGAGGDTAVFCQGTRAEIEKALLTLRQRCADAFAAAQYHEEALQSFWPGDKLLPNGAQVSISRHAKDYGDVLLNGSLSMVVDTGGHFRVGSFYSQVTSASGAFLGSSLINLKPELRDQISKSLNGIQAFCESMHLLGLVGVDFMLVKGNDGGIRVFFYEVNGRPSSSAMAELVSQKLGAQTFLQGVVKAEAPITTFSEARDRINAIGADLLGGTESGARLVILALSSRWQDMSGRRVLTHGSKAFKVMAVGPTSESCAELFQRLQAGGISCS